MRFKLGIPVLLAAVTACSPSTKEAFAGPSDPGARQPVVVELFSSEGCSSCPSADKVLSALSKAQPVAGAEILALEFHVDYWNYLGWTDPFSSASYTSRQRTYADIFKQHGMYTPQMVVDGQNEFVGSRDSAARDAIGAAAKAVKAKVQLTRKDDHVSVTVADLPDTSAEADVFLAVTEDGLRTEVLRGENGGSTLAHAPVVRKFEKIGTIPAGTRGPAFKGEAPVTIDRAWKRDNVRVVVFVQRKNSLAIMGAGAIAMK